MIFIDSRHLRRMIVALENQYVVLLKLALAISSGVIAGGVAVQALHWVS